MEAHPLRPRIRSHVREATHLPEVEDFVQADANTPDDHARQLRELGLGYLAETPAVAPPDTAGLPYRPMDDVTQSLWRSHYPRTVNQGWRVEVPPDVLPFMTKAKNNGDFERQEIWTTDDGNEAMVVGISSSRGRRYSPVVQWRADGKRDPVSLEELQALVRRRIRRATRKAFSARVRHRALMLLPILLTTLSVGGLFWAVGPWAFMPLGIGAFIAVAFWTLEYAETGRELYLGMAALLNAGLLIGWIGTGVDAYNTYTYTRTAEVCGTSGYYNDGVATVGSGEIKLDPGYYNGRYYTDGTKVTRSLVGHTVTFHMHGHIGSRYATRGDSVSIAASCPPK